MTTFQVQYKFSVFLTMIREIDVLKVVDLVISQNNLLKKGC